VAFGAHDLVEVRRLSRRPEPSIGRRSDDLQWTPIVFQIGHYVPTLCTLIAVIDSRFDRYCWALSWCCR
jgi:hypothetical protein